ncbi:MAG: hypothetical protein QM642_06045 [Edaphocola sp.]
MPYTTHIGACSISFDLKPHSVHITGGRQLLEAMRGAPFSHTQKLVRDIKSQFEAQYGRPLAIGDNSLIMEIWGHVYYENIVLKCAKLMNLGEAKTMRLTRYSEVIDCGEKGHDNNRWFWDLLAPVKKMFALFLK